MIKMYNKLKKDLNLYSIAMRRSKNWKIKLINLEQFNMKTNKKGKAFGISITVCSPP